MALLLIWKKIKKLLALLLKQKGIRTLWGRWKRKERWLRNGGGPQKSKESLTHKHILSLILFSDTYSFPFNSFFFNFHFLIS